MNLYYHLIIQVLTGITYLAVFTAYCGYFYGLCTYLSALVDDFGRIASKIDNPISKDENGEFIAQNILNELIQLHNDILE